MTLKEHIKLIWPNRSFTIIGEKFYTTDGGPNISPQDIENTYQQALDLYYKKTEIDILINEGFKVEPEGFILGLQESDRSAFFQALTLINQAENLGLLTDDSIQEISDINGTRKTVSVRRFKEIVVSYGFYYMTLWSKKN